MQISIIAAGIIVLSYLFIKWLKKRSRFSRVQSVKALSTLLNITMQVDQSVTEEEIKEVSNCLYDLIKRSGPDGPFSEYWTKEEGQDFLDAEVVSSMCAASAAYVSEIGFKHSETEMDSQVYAEFDSLADLIIKDHREYAFKSLVALCGADSELHPNELKVLNYLSEKLKVENKEKIIAEERKRIEKIQGDTE
tara:strand:- start:176 stop:754 length:579 start_codon:yes stop_codon:yes gene_type:complete